MTKLQERLREPIKLINDPPWHVRYLNGTQEGLLIRERDEAANALDAAEAEIARLKNFLQFLKTPLQEIDGLFGDIRNDWTDPRHECRSGRESVAIVEAMIEELLRTKDAG